METFWTVVWVIWGTIALFAGTAVMLAIIIILWSLACVVYDWLRWW